MTEDDGFFLSIHQKISKSIQYFKNNCYKVTTCEICFETFRGLPEWHMTNLLSFHKTTGVPCCRANVCYECSYRHVKSITFDRTSLRRLQCPFGCDQDWNDLLVRFVIRHHYHPTWARFQEYLWKPVMRFLAEEYFYIWFNVSVTVIFLLKVLSVGSCFLWKEFLKIFLFYAYGCVYVSWWKRKIYNQSHRFDNLMMNAASVFLFVYLFVPNLFLYFIFSIHTNLALFITLYASCRDSFQRLRNRILNVICPNYRRANTEIAMYEDWTVEYALARQKGVKALDDILRCPVPNCKNLFLVPSVYRSKKTENEKSYLRLIIGPGEDRKIFCAACNISFCGLCKLPWTSLYNHNLRHSGRSCSNYKKVCKTVPDDDGYAAVALSYGARGCPNCSIRVQRSDGCNHMTCICGFEWCYVCGKKWSVRHYRCRDIVDDSAFTGNCLIS